MRPKRILFIGHRAELAGAEIALANFAAHLDRRHFLPSVLLPRPGALGELLSKHHVPFYCLPPPSYELAVETAWDNPFNLRAVAPLRDAILGLSPDVVVVNTNTIPQAVIAVLTTAIPLVVHLHAFVARHQSEWQAAQSREADRMWLPFADKIVACSGWVARFYEELLGQTVDVVANTTAFEAARGERPAASPQFVMLATLEAHKRADLFIEAAALLQREHPQIAFACHIYGDGAQEQRDRLVSSIERQGAATKVFLHPSRIDTAMVYQAATCAVVPSDIEPFSMVAIEAAASARPVIATRSGGPDDIVIDGETGILIDTGDAVALKNAMLAILQNPAGAAQMGEAARARFDRYYALDAVMPVYESLLDSAITTPTGERRQLAQAAARYFMSRHGN